MEALFDRGFSVMKYAIPEKERNYIPLFTSCSVLHRAGQHLCSHCDVFLLRPGCHRPSHAEVSVVEAIPHVSAAGEWPPALYEKNCDCTNNMLVK